MAQHRFEPSHGDSGLPFFTVFAMQDTEPATDVVSPNVWRYIYSDSAQQTKADGE
jgi:hypothetical protein